MGIDSHDSVGDLYLSQFRIQGAAPESSQAALENRQTPTEGEE